MTLKDIIAQAIYDSLARNKWSRTAAAKDLKCAVKTIRNHIAALRAKGIQVPPSEVGGGQIFRKYTHNVPCPCSLPQCKRAIKMAKYKKHREIGDSFCARCGARKLKRCARCLPSSPGGYCVKCGQLRCECAVALTPAAMP